MSGDNEALEKEYKRWRDYGNVLLIALTVLFAGPMIAGEKTAFSILSAVAGVIGIVLVVMWYAKEYKIQIFNKPALLILASFSLGIQATFLAFQIIVA